MTALLTDNLPLLAGAPNGIKKLRELILELAVRGKLVPQDPNDEPASELLKRIAEEKARLVAEGNIKKQKPLAGVAPEEVPFDIPVNWEWVRIAAVGHDWGQKTPDQLFTYIDVGSVNNAAGVISSPQVVAAEEAPSRARKVVMPGTVIYSTIRPYLLNVAVIEERYEQEPIASTAFAIIHPLLEMPSRYFLWYLRSPIFVRYVESVQTGIAYPAINDGQFFSGLIPLPPLAEQHRIVAKVDELMALCDRLEAQQADAESAHAQLVQALLDSLTQAADAEDFAASWQRLAEHFHTLFTTEPSIDVLKQTLLQLAVLGKLVPQHPNDEPASELLKRTAEERARLVAEGKFKKLKPLAEITEAEKTFEIPKSWEWVRLEEIAHVGTGATPLRTNPQYFESATINWVTSGETSQDFIYETEQMVSSLALKETNLTVYPPHTLIIAMYGQGKTRGQISELLIDACTNQACAAVQLFDKDESHRRYVKYFFVKSYDDIRSLAAGGAQPNLNLGKIKETVLPLPPATEQHRIVTKVDQLMAICDQLKTRLTQARQLNEQLATELVEQAVADDNRQSPNTSGRKAARTLLAAEITHRLHGHRTFGQRKLQKAIYLAEHTAKIALIQGSYLRNVAGPHDRQLMDEVEGELHKQQWYERIKRDTMGHAYRPLAKAGQHRQAYEGIWSAAERATIDQVIALMRDWDTDRCEMNVTLYAAWNDFILEGRPITDDSIVDEVMHRWNDAKLRFSKAGWLEVLAEMKKHSLLTPSGFGKRTIGGTLTLPGFE